MSTTAEHYYANYRLLAGAIVAEQCREYYEIFRKAVNSPDKRRRRKAAFARYMLTKHSYGDYLDLDMTALVEEIERKAVRGEEIKWKGEYGRK